MSDNFEIVRNNYRMYAGLRTRQYDYYVFGTLTAEGQEEAFRAIKSFTLSFMDSEKPKGLLLVGGVGSGKTFMVSSVVNEIIENIEIEESEAKSAFVKSAETGYGFWCMRPQIPVLFISVADLMNQFKSYFSRPPEDDISHRIMDVLRSVELLILDDLGAEKSSDWVREKLFEIIDYRYNEDLPMLVTTNCVPKELKKQIGDRNYDRLREMCALVSVTAKSQRQTAQA